MKSRQESTSPGRWSELLLGGALAGVGAPLLLKGAHRWLHLRRGTSTASVGWTAGLLGALVAGRLARRHGRAGSAPAPMPPPELRLLTLAPEAAGESRRVPQVPGALVSEPPGEPPRLAPLASVALASAGSGEDEAGVDEWQREVRRWRAVLARHAEEPADGDASSLEVERRLRRGPSGREQPWHEALEATPA